VAIISTPNRRRIARDRTWFHHTRQNNAMTQESFGIMYYRIVKPSYSFDRNKESMCIGRLFELLSKKQPLVVVLILEFSNSYSSIFRRSKLRFSILTPSPIS